MKNLLKVIICVIVLFAVTEANAQKKVGGGLFYASEYDKAGISINGSYAFSDNFSAAPSFSYLFVDAGTMLFLDLDVNYQFTELDFGSLYGIGGLNVALWSWEGHSNTDVGFNLGLGLGLPLGDNLTLAPELRYTITDHGFIRFGVKLLIEI